MCCKTIEYTILNFIIVFAAISSFVKCKQCDGNVKLQIASVRAASDLKFYYYVISACLSIAVYIAACVFNEGSGVLLKMLQFIGVSCPNVHKYAEKEDTARIKISDRRVQENTLEGRMRRRQEQIDVLEAATAAAKGLLYGPRMG